MIIIGVDESDGYKGITVKLDNTIYNRENSGDCKIDAENTGKWLSDQGATFWIYSSSIDNYPYDIEDDPDYCLRELIMEGYGKKPKSYDFSKITDRKKQNSKIYGSLVKIQHVIQSDEIDISSKILAHVTCGVAAILMFEHDDHARNESVRELENYMNENLI